MRWVGSTLRGPRDREWRAWLPFALVLLSLLALAIVPILTNRRIEAHRAVIIGTADPARSLLRDIELALALESAGTRGYLLTGEERYAVSHVRARSQRNRALARLLPLARRLSPESYAEATRLARDLAPAEARLDSLYQGLLSGTEYTARLERDRKSVV